MTGRSVPEWQGATPDTRPPARVRLRVFLAHDGVCYLSRRKIGPGDDWECDHVRALINGGLNVESNLAPVLKAPHRVKTNADVAEKAKVDRIAKKHLGITRPSGFGNRCRKMNGTVGMTKRAHREGADQ